MQRHARSGPCEGAHHLPAFHLRQVDRFAFILDGEIDRFSAIFHQMAHMGSRDGGEAAGLGERAADDEGLNAHRPKPPIVSEFCVALLLQRRQQPMRRRRRQPDPLGEIRQGRSFVGRFRDPVEKRQRAYKRLHLIAACARGRPGGASRSRKIFFRGLPFHRYPFPPDLTVPEMQNNEETPTSAGLLSTIRENRHESAASRLSKVRMLL